MKKGEHSAKDIIKDEREQLVEKIIEHLEKGTAPWQKPWEAKSGIPYNPVTDSKYKGINSLKLTVLSMEKGYEDSRCCLLYTSPSPRDGLLSRMPSSA